MVVGLKVKSDACIIFNFLFINASYIFEQGSTDQSRSRPDQNRNSAGTVLGKESDHTLVSNGPWTKRSVDPCLL